MATSNTNANVKKNEQQKASENSKGQQENDQAKMDMTNTYNQWLDKGIPQSNRA